MSRNDQAITSAVEYEFTLRFDATRVALDPELWVEALGDAGCDDATVGIGISGRFAMVFARTAESAEDAVLSALCDVHGAIPRARLIEASPDLVGITEVAELVGRSRQNMRKLLLACDSDGPLPVHEGSTSLWHLAPVLEWLRDVKHYAIPEALLEVATANMQVNAASSTVRIVPRILRDVEEYAAEA